MKGIPTPAECGLPAKFDSWRPNQEHALSVMITSQKRVIGLSAPTGFGKSPMYIAYALMTGKRTCIVTNTKGLQDQLMKDFESVGLVDIRGKDNYPCEMNDDYSCEDGYAAHCPYRRTAGCAYANAEMKASAAPLVVTNYAMWTNSSKSGAFSTFDQVVFDEGHETPQAISNAMKVELGYAEIEEKMNVPFPRHDTGQFAVWRAWAGNAKHEAELQLEQAKALVDGSPSPKKSWIREVVHLRRLVRRLAVLSTASPDNWIVEQVEDGFEFDPIRSHMYAEGALLFGLPKIIVVSATLRPKTLYMIGQPKSQFDFYEFDSDFSRERCPVYWIPTMRVDARADDLSLLWTRLDQIVSRRRDRKGIVHTISYARQQDVLAHSRFAQYMMTNAKREPISNLVNVYKKAGPGAIMVSPSVGQGYDFPGQDCEWQFLCKIPFPDGRSKINKARSEFDKEYGPYMAMQAMVQSFGRGMRYRDDQCENFIADDHLSWFLPRYAHLAPKSFHTFFKRVHILPQPPLSLAKQG